MVADAGEPFFAKVPGKRAGLPFGDDQPEFAAAHLDQIALLGDLQGQILVIQLEFGLVLPFPLVVYSLQPQHIRAGSGDGHLLDGTLHAPLILAVADAEQPETAVVFGQPDFPDLFAVIGNHTGLHQPGTVVELHGSSSPYVSVVCCYYKGRKNVRQSCRLPKRAERKPTN